MKSEEVLAFAREQGMECTLEELKEETLKSREMSLDEMEAIRPPFPTGDPSLNPARFTIPSLLATTVISSPVEEAICPLVRMTSLNSVLATVSVIIPRAAWRSGLIFTAPS